MKTILLIIVIFFAVGIAMALIARLNQTQQRLAQLHDELRRTDEKLDRQRRDLERRQAEQDANNQR